MRALLPGWILNFTAFRKQDKEEINMINIKAIFDKSDFLKQFNIDQILFEGAYPVLFTMTDRKRELLAICPVADAKEMVWIFSETSFETIIAMLQNEITIREAFEADSVEKHIVRYDGKDILHEKVELSDVSKEYLPDEGEYIDAEEDEFDEEITYYRYRNDYRQITVPSLLWIVYPLPKRKGIVKREANKNKNTLVQDVRNRSFYNIPLENKSLNSVR